MSRRAKYTFPLPDGRTVGATYKIRGNYFRVQFPDPEAGPGDYRHVEVSTGVEVPKNFNPEKHNPPNDWFTETTKIIRERYAPTLPTDPQSVSWDAIIAELEGDTTLRSRSLEAYTSTLGIFLQYVPTSKGPGDVTPEVAKAFRKKYAADGFKRSPQSDAKTYPRAAKTVENAIRRMSGLWGKMMPKYATSNPWDHVSRPTVPKRQPVVPTEDEVKGFFKWLAARYPGWELPGLFVEVKALAGCRLNDLCHVRSWQFDPVGQTLTIRPEQDKTHRERKVPLPADLVAALDRIKGPTYLWERYLEGAKTYRWGTKNANRNEFTPSLLYNAMKNIFREFGKGGGKLRSHGLRKRAITLTALATQNLDLTAQAIGIDAQTARKYYLDAKAAFDGQDVMKRMAGVLRPPQDAPKEGN